MFFSGTPATIATGTCTRKIDCQETSSVRSPPNPGPTAAPIAPAPTQVAIARRLSPKVETISSRAPTTATAPPIACTARPVRSGPSPVARPQTRLPPANTARPIAADLPGPYLLARCAAGTASRANTRLKMISTQETPEMLVSNSRKISGSARTTIDESARTSPTAPARAAVRRFISTPAPGRTRACTPAASRAPSSRRPWSRGR